MPRDQVIKYSPEYVEGQLMLYDTSILINTEESRRGFPAKAKRFFHKVEEILEECIDMSKRTCPDDTKYEVFRSLNKVLRYLSNMESKNVYSLLQSELSHYDICLKLKKILDSLKDYLHTFKQVKSGFKAKVSVYSYIHEVVYSQIGHRIKIMLDLLQPRQIHNWKPVDEFYKRTEWLGVIVATHEDVVITRKNIVDGDVRKVLSYDDSDFLSSATSTQMEGVDQLDWSLISAIERKNCPATYTIVHCNAIEPLLEIAKRFTRAVVALKAIASPNVDYIFLMCKALLLQASKFVAYIECDQAYVLFDKVYSVLNYILPEVVEFKGDERSIIQISKECTYLWKLSNLFRGNFDPLEVTIDDYLDILYKYLVVYITPAHVPLPEWPFFFVMDLCSFAINKASPARHTTLNIHRAEDVKFKKIIELHSLDPENPDLCCGICLQALNFAKPITISIMEKCGHAFCIECIIETVNKSTDGPALESLPNSIKCPREDCSAQNTSFTSGEQFGNFLIALCNFPDSMDEGSGAGSASSSRNSSRAGTRPIPMQEAGTSKDMLTVPQHSNRRGASGLDPAHSMYVLSIDDDSQNTDEALSESQDDVATDQSR